LWRIKAGKNPSDDPPSEKPKKTALNLVDAAYEQPVGQGRTRPNHIKVRIHEEKREGLTAIAKKTETKIEREEKKKERRGGVDQKSASLTAGGKWGKRDEIIKRRNMYGGGGRVICVSPR